MFDDSVKCSVALQLNKSTNYISLRFPCFDSASYVLKKNGFQYNHHETRISSIKPHPGPGAEWLNKQW